MTQFKRFFLTLITICLTAGLLIPQSLDKKIEVEKQKLSRATGKEKIRILAELAWLHRKHDSKKCIEYGQDALQLAQELKDADLQATALSRIGLGHGYLSDYKQALRYHQQSYELWKGITDQRGMAVALNNMAVAYKNSGDLEQSLNYHQQALSIKKQIGDKKFLLSTLGNIGILYARMDRLNSGLKYLLESLALGEELGHIRSQTINTTQIGNIYYLLKDYTNALKYYKKGLSLSKEQGGPLGIATNLLNIGSTYNELKNYPLALQYLNDALAQYKKTSYEHGIASTVGTLGRVYFNLQKYDQSLAYHQQCLTIGQKLDDKMLCANCCGDISNIFRIRNQLDKALKQAQLALTYAIAAQSKITIQNCYLTLARVYAARRQFHMAYRNLQEYVKISEEIYNKNITNQIADMQTRYETLQKEKQNEKLKSENLINKLRISRERLLRYGLIAGLFLVLLLALLLFKKYLYLFAFWKKQKYIAHFRLMDVIGMGGMGTVYRAHDIRDKSRTVAIKVMNPEFFNDETSKMRFKQEAAIIDQLQHPNIVQILERGESDGRLFIVMEYLQGTSLGDKIFQEGRLPLDTASVIISQIVDALKLIHSKNIVHRDLKPANIYLVEDTPKDYLVKLLDFGLAKYKYQTKLTKTGIIAGTIQYMAPEQLLGLEVSAASDIYSLGALFYETVVGHSIYADIEDSKLFHQILNDTPIPPQKYRSDLPDQVNDLIVQMLAKDPINRPDLNYISWRLE